MTDKKEKCPKCGSSMYANGCCDDCGYSAKAEKSEEKGKPKGK